VGPDAEEIRIGQGGVARERAPEDESVRQMLKHSAKGGVWRGKREKKSFCAWPSEPSRIKKPVAQFAVCASPLSVGTAGSPPKHYSPWIARS